MASSSRENLTRQHAAALAMAQRAHKKKREGHPSDYRQHACGLDAQGDDGYHVQYQAHQNFMYQIDL
jgi:hypothetical protein